MKIMLDAGHGGSDPGAVSNGYKEKDITIAIVRELAEIFVTRLPDVEIVLVREADETVTPGERQRLCMYLKPFAFISVHCNSFADPRANGSEVVYREEDDKVLAMHIQSSMIMDLKLKNRGLVNDLDGLKRRLAVLSTPGIPSVIVEPGFMSNAKDLAVLLNYGAVANAIFAGVETWLQRL